MELYNKLIMQVYQLSMDTHDIKFQNHHQHVQSVGFDQEKRQGFKPNPPVGNTETQKRSLARPLQIEKEKKRKRKKKIWSGHLKSTGLHFSVDPRDPIDGTTINQSRCIVLYMTLVRDAHISVSGRKGTFATDDVKSETLFLYISLSATIY